jgi:hypothetical protein
MALSTLTKVTRGATVNANYIVDALGKFLKVFKQKRPVMVAGDLWFYLDNAPVHTANMVTDWMAARQIWVFQHQPYLPDLASANFFLFPRVKRELACLALSQETFKKEGEGAVRTLLVADFATPFRRWYECCKKCFNISRSNIEK